MPARAATCSRLKPMERNRNRRALPYLVSFVKFSTGFAAIVTVALLMLRFAHA